MKDDRTLKCRSVYTDDDNTNMVECSFADWSEAITPAEARKRAGSLLFLIATSAVEANAASTLTTQILVGEKCTEEQKAATFHKLLSDIRNGRNFSEIDGMSPIFGARTCQPLVSINWAAEPLTFGLEEGAEIANNLFACAEAADTDNWLQQSVKNAGVSQEILDRILANFAEYRQKSEVES